MKLRTSFFNVTVLRKNLTRFAPLWVLATILEILCLLGMNVDNPSTAAWNLLLLMGSMAILNMIYAVNVAGCVFRDLFDSRMCNGLHAMPMRREGWLLTNLASGFLFALIPAVAGGLVAAVMLRECYWVSFLWQGTILLQFVFFFGVAVFSAICAGKKMGMIAIYALINFLSVLIYWIAKLFYEPLLPGVVLSAEAFDRFSPVVTMAAAEYVEFGYESIHDLSREALIAQDWTYLLICVGIGIIFLAISWLLYRKRHLETAGDFISFRPLKMVFLLAYTFTVGAFVHSVFGAFAAEEGKYGFLVVGVLIGWITGWMLLERTVKVFSRKMLLGFVAFALLFSGSMVVTAIDPTGRTAYIPETNDVEYACMYIKYDSYFYDSDWKNGGWYQTEPEDIAQVQQLHQKMMDTPKAENAKTIPISVRYQLKDGREIHRSYEIPIKSQTAEDLSRAFSNVQAVLNTNDDWETIQENIQSVRIYWNADRPDTLIHASQKEQLEPLLEAFAADCLAGNMAQYSGFHEYFTANANLEISWKDQQYGNRTEYVTVYASCANLYVLLRQM